MADHFKRELKTAFFDTGVLAAGGITGAALTFWLFDSHWLVNGIGAVIGASVAYHAGRYAAGSTEA